MNGRERVMAALRHEPVDRPPVWFMRQAGRHLPEYRALAEQADFWERCKNLDLCTTITAQPIERYPQLDAAIVFSDILTPLPALGYEVEYGGGIRITPFTFDDVEAWPEFEARTHAPWAANALAALPEVLPRDVARLGFAGCPWTVGMYLIAGGTGDKEFVNTRAKVHADPEAAMRLFLRLGDIVGNLLADQVVHGGADAVQLFDTWAGLLDEATYRRFAMPATARAIDVFRAKCPTRTPLIHYAKASGHLHGAIMELDIDGLSLDWRDDLRAYRASHGKRLALQGNLDPTFMHGSTEAAVSAAETVLEAAGDAPGYIFNLGHGFAPSARIECVEAVLRTVEGR